MTKEYLDLKIDFMFKQLFGQPSRKHITIAFLNDLLGRTGDDKITDLTFENTVADYRQKKPDEDLISELEEWAMNKDQVREALIEWETLSANTENRKLYEARKKELMDLLSNLEGAQRVGEKRGEERGIKEGKREVALKMLEKGYDISTIAEITNLSEQEIQQLLS